MGELVAVREEVDGEPAFNIGEVLRITSDGVALSYKVKLYRCDAHGSYSPTRGKSSRHSVDRASIILVGIQLTTKTSKLTKQDRNKINDILLGTNS